MHFKTRNVTTAFNMMVKGIYDKSVPTRITQSRNGPVMVIDEPVTITYEKPLERVLLNVARDCNPFFHLYESLWMLSGRNDVAPLAYYASNMLNYSDDGKTFNGAYGYRWRNNCRTIISHSCGVDTVDQQPDQLKLLIDHLKADPSSRRAVLQMWNVEDDLLKISSSGSYPCCESVQRVERIPGDARTLTGGTCPIHGGTHYQPASKDTCCNLSVTFLIRDHYGAKHLDMTVFNRSNDMIWGTLGANAVHFSFLQEYMAAALGVEVGNYHQISSNLHVYQNNWKPEEWLAEGVDLTGQGYGAPCFHVPLFRSPVAVKSFDEKVKQFVEANKDEKEVTTTISYNNDFLDDVAQPMIHAFHMHKQRDYGAAYHWLARVGQSDWRRIGQDWIKIRHQNWEKKRDGQRTTTSGE